jgi:hypothetical protein
MNSDTTMLESYHSYLPPQKVSKNPQTYCICNTLSKSAKNHFGYLHPLRVKHKSRNIMQLQKAQKKLIIFFKKSLPK